MGDKFEVATRTTVLAGLQAIPGVGGAIAQILGDSWRAPYEKKVESFLNHLAEQLQKLGVPIESFRDRFENSELAQSVLHEGLAQAVRTTADFQRQQLASALVRGLNAKDRELADVRFLLRAWGELDEVEQAIFVVVSRFGFTDDDAEARFPEIFGPEYFGSESDEFSSYLRDSAHRCRINHMINIGLLRPRDEQAWKEGRVRVDKFTSYFPTKFGETLASLLGIDTHEQNA